MLTEHIFKDTGKSVKIRKVSPMVAVDIEKSIPRPKPPMNTVDYGNGPVQEANYSDPGYMNALEERQAEVGFASLRATIMRGVVVEGDEWKDEVLEYRKFIFETTEKELEEKSDLIVYIMRICMGTQEDMNDLLLAISTRSQPTQEVIDQAKSRFPD